MRVIAGTARSVPLLGREGLETRPTADRVKEALFNILQFELQGRRVLDLFGGSGQLAIEALSRGAEHAVITDFSEAAVSIIRENLKRTKLSEKATVIQTDYANYLKNCRETYQIIFLDPPYAEKFLENSLKIISEIDILTLGGIIVTERSVDKLLEFTPTGYSRSKDYRYGKTVLTLFRKQ